MIENYELEFLGFEPKAQSILKEVLAGLSKSQKSIPPKLLYDKRGSEIFEKICQLKEYYPTRAETEILRGYSREIVEYIGPQAILIEPGSGAGDKVRYLLNHLKDLKAYVPIEISKEILLRMMGELGQEYPSINVIPVCADFMEIDELPFSMDESEDCRKVVFFPGSTIGNLTPAEAVHFLKRFGRIIGHNGGVLIGVDLKKDPKFFKAAYDDPHGVTAEFNLNLLERLNRETAAQFNVKNFSHDAYYNEKLGRVEMHLVSRVSQQVKVNQTVFRFRQGETIHTENSYKYTVEEFCELAAKARLNIKKTWKDESNLFCVYYFERV
jgi:dimethylhistidine N-methyltransferase